MNYSCLAAAAAATLATGAWAQVSCDQTINTGSLELTQGGVACAADNITTPNFFAKSYDLGVLLPGQAMELSCIDFGITSSDTGAIAGTVTVYVDTNGGAPTAPGTDLNVIDSATFTLNPTDGLNVIQQVTFNPPLNLAANGVYVVELGLAAATDGFAAIAGNTGPDNDTYIRSDDCAIATYTSYSAIGFPTQFWAMQLSGDTTIDGAGCNCFTGSDCFIANGTPGCDDEFCEIQVCNNFDQFCCTDEWDESCAQAALDFCTFSPNDCTDPPASNATEDEACGVDANGGCNTDPLDPSAFETIASGDFIAGRFFVDSTADIRDTDWYDFSISETSIVTLNGWARVGLDLLIVQGGPCDADGDGTTDVAVLASGSGECPTVTSICLPAGDYRAFIAPNTSGGNLPCDLSDFTGYVLNLETEAVAFCPGQEPCPGGDLGVSPNSDTTIANGGVACASAAEGVTRENTFAVTIDLSTGDTAGSDVNISCVTFGVSSSSDPIDATVEIWEDTDGGAPSAPGGADLVSLGSNATTLYQGLGTQNAVFDPPICVPAGTQLVVTLDIPASTTGDTRIAGNAAPSTSETYVASAACGITTFTSLTDLGFPDENWVVSLETTLGCDSASCPADFNNDGIVDGADFGQILVDWGPCPAPCASDLDGDGVVSGADVGQILVAWGACP